MLARRQSCRLHVLRFKRVKNSGDWRKSAMPSLGNQIVSSNHVDDFFAVDDDRTGVGQQCGRSINRFDAEAVENLHVVLTRRFAPEVAAIQQSRMVEGRVFVNSGNGSPVDVVIPEDEALHRNLTRVITRVATG